MEIVMDIEIEIINGDVDGDGEYKILSKFDSLLSLKRICLRYTNFILKGNFFNHYEKLPLTCLPLYGQETAV